MRTTRPAAAAAPTLLRPGPASPRRSPALARGVTCQRACGWVTCLRSNAGLRIEAGNTEGATVQGPDRADRFMICGRRLVGISGQRGTTQAALHSCRVPCSSSGWSGWDRRPGRASRRSTAGSSCQTGGAAVDSCRRCILFYAQACLSLVAADKHSCSAISCCSRQLLMLCTYRDVAAATPPCQAHTVLLCST